MQEEFKWVNLGPLSDIDSATNEMKTRVDECLDEIERYQSDFIKSLPGLTRGVGYAITGKRGVGKTSFLRCLTSRLESAKYAVAHVTLWDLMPDREKLPLPDVVFWRASRAVLADSPKSASCAGPLDEKHRASKTCAKCKVYWNLEEAASGLMIRREEAAQAAIAFSDGPDEYARTFATRLAGLESWENYRKALEKALAASKRPLILALDDADLEPRASLPLLRAAAALREVPGVITVVAADAERCMSQIAVAHRSPKDNPLASSEIQNLWWALRGDREIRRYPWAERHRIEFLKKAKVHDGCTVWGWYLLNEVANGQSIGDVLKSAEASDTVRAFAYQPTPIQTSHDLLCEMLVVADSKKDTTKEFSRYLAAYDYLNFDPGRLRSISRDWTEKDWGYLEALLRLLPSNPREFAVLTNLLISQLSEWKQAERPFDRLFAKKEGVPLCARRAKVLNCLSWVRWGQEEFGRTLWNKAWNIYGTVNREREAGSVGADGGDSGKGQLERIELSAICNVGTLSAREDQANLFGLLCDEYRKMAGWLQSQQGAAP